jgi:hypothetical protein
MSSSSFSIDQMWDLRWWMSLRMMSCCCYSPPSPQMPVLQVLSKQGTDGAQETNSIVEMKFGEFCIFHNKYIPIWPWTLALAGYIWIGVTNENRFNNSIDGISLWNSIGILVVKSYCIFTKICKNRNSFCYRLNAITCTVYLRKATGSVTYTVKTGTLYCTYLSYTGTRFLGLRETAGISAYLYQYRIPNLTCSISPPPNTHLVTDRSVTSTLYQS